MYERFDDRREMRSFMETLAREVHAMRSDLLDVIRECREAQFVRMRLELEMPGYWEDSVRLGTVKKRLGDSL